MQATFFEMTWSNLLPGFEKSASWSPVGGVVSLSITPDNLDEVQVGLQQLARMYTSESAQ